MKTPRRSANRMITQSGGRTSKANWPLVKTARSCPNNNRASDLITLESKHYNSPTTAQRLNFVNCYDALSSPFSYLKDRTGNTKTCSHVQRPNLRRQLKLYGETYDK